MSAGALALQHLFDNPIVQAAVRDRFWSKVDIKGADECWPWLGAKRSNGYPHFWLGSHETTVSAGAVAAVLSGTKPGLGLFACHHCDNPACCNPGHLYFGTPLDNAADAVRRDRLPHYTRMAGEDHGSARLSAAQVEEIRRRFKPGAGSQPLADEFGVSLTHIYRICTGESWRAMRTPTRKASP